MHRRSSGFPDGRFCLVLEPFALAKVVLCRSLPKQRLEECARPKAKLCHGNLRLVLRLLANYLAVLIVPATQLGAIGLPWVPVGFSPLTS